MSRMGRIHIPGAVYHVILRGNDQREVFVDDKDRFRFYSILEYAFRHFPFRIHAFCLMTNHIHLEAQVADVPLPRIMQRIAQRYTQWFNWRHGRSGHLFQGRYKAILIEADEYLKELAAYIHLNPVRARIVKCPEKYRWSSHLAYLGKTTLPWIETDFILSTFSSSRPSHPLDLLILSTFSSSDRKKAQALFGEFVDSMIGQGRNKSFHGERDMDKRLLGDDYFVLDILEGIEEAPPEKPGLEATIEAIKSILGEDAHQLLTTSGRDARSFEARALAAWAVIELSSATVTELGKYCHRDQSTMSYAARRIEELKVIRPDLAAQMVQLRSALTPAPKAPAPRPLPAEDASGQDQGTLVTFLTIPSEGDRTVQMLQKLPASPDVCYGMSRWERSTHKKKSLLASLMHLRRYRRCPWRSVVGYLSRPNLAGQLVSRVALRVLIRVPQCLFSLNGLA